jgi:hypothetical protein
VEPGETETGRIFIHHTGEDAECRFAIDDFEQTSTFPAPEVTLTFPLGSTNVLGPGQSQVAFYDITAASTIDNSYAGFPELTISASPVGYGGPCTSFTDGFQIIPTGDNTANGAWATTSGKTTMYVFQPETLPPTAVQAGWKVKEVLETYYDTCHFTNSLYRICSPAQGTWTVNAARRYEDATGTTGDLIGALEERVTYYRNQGMAPCACAIGQRMKFEVPPGISSTGWLTYQEHVIEAGLDVPAVNDVTNTRHTNTQTKACATPPC